MATDDVHDLFDTGEDDESDESAGDEPSDESDESSKWDEIRSQVEEEESAADPSPEWSLDSTPTRDDDADQAGPTESTASTGGASEDDPGGFELGASGGSSGEAGEESHDGSRRSPATTSSEAASGDDAGDLELGASRQSTEGTTGEEGEVESAESTTLSAESTTPSAGEANEASARSDPGASTETSPTPSAEETTAGSTKSEPARSTETPSTGDVRDDPGEPEPTESRSAEGLFDEEPDETGSEESTSTGELFDEQSDETGSEGSTSRGELFEEVADEGERGPAESTSSREVMEEDVDEAEPAESTSPGVPAEDGPDEPRAAESTASAREAVEERTGASDRSTASAAEEGRDATDSDGATASADGATVDDQGASASGTTASSADGPGADTGQAETAGRTESPSKPADSADDEGTTAPASGSNRLPLGIDVLDEAMGGGVPPGRLVVLVADPGVQSELIVDTILAQRDTLYVTTDRPDWEVQKDIEPGLGSGEVVIRDHSPDSLLSGLDSLLDDLGTSSNFVLDSVNELELVPRKRYRVFLSDVKRRLFDTGSMGLLTGVTTAHESARDLTLRRADIVLRLETQTTDREIQNLLSVPKFRGGAAIEETFKLELTDEVRVDTSWNEG